VGAEFEPIQTAAEVFRRAGVRPQLEGEQQRIFDAVVRPDRAKADGGNAEAEAAGLRGEIARAEGMLGNERFVSNAPGEVVEAEREKLERYKRELDALSAGLARTALAVAGEVRPRAHACAPGRAGPAAARLPRDPRRRHERQVDCDPAGGARSSPTGAEASRG